MISRVRSALASLPIAMTRVSAVHHWASSYRPPPAWSVPSRSTIRVQAEIPSLTARKTVRRSPDNLVPSGFGVAMVSSSPANGMACLSLWTRPGS